VPRERGTAGSGGETLDGEKVRYRYHESGIIYLTWDDVMDMCRCLAVAVRQGFDPDLIVGIAHGGVIPAAIVASMLQKDFYPVRLTRRWHGRVVSSKPRVVVPLSEDVEHRTVLIVDETTSTGDTLRLACQEAYRQGARKAKTATLYVYTGSYRPNFYAMECDAVVVHPWDYETLFRGEFIINPEYQARIDRALMQQDD